MSAWATTGARGRVPEDRRGHARVPLDPIHPQGRVPWPWLWARVCRVPTVRMSQGVQRLGVTRMRTAMGDRGGVLRDTRRGGAYEDVP